MSRPSLLLATLAQRLLFCSQNQKDYPGIFHQRLETLSNYNRKLIQLAPHADANETIHLIDAIYSAHNMLDRLEYQILQLRAEGTQQQVHISTDDGYLIPLSVQIRDFFLHQACRMLTRDFDLHHFTKQHREDLTAVVMRWYRFNEALQEGFSVRVHDAVHSTETQSRVEKNPAGSGQPELVGLHRGILGSAPVSLGEPELVGRDREKECILRFLTRTAANAETCSYVNVELLPIVGVGGVGKTALARWAYNEEIVMQLFDLTVWVRASGAVQMERLMFEIVESTSTSIEKPPGFHDSQYLDSVRKILCKGLAGKRFLIVLDDVRVEKEAFSGWEMLLETLKVGKEGSKVVITTRSRTVATSTGTFNRLYLKVLKDADCWSLFKQCAFGDENPEDHPELKDIGMTVAMRLGGLPLEAKLLGGLLKSNFNASLWRGILKEYSKLEANSEAFPSVRLSYAYLPEHLKQCFAYSSLFPQDYGFQKNRLVRIWIALGFVIPREGIKIEAIGREYFDDLLQRFFFEKKQYQDGYVIHDKLYDVACRAASNECHVIKDYTCDTFPSKVRHIYVCDSPEIISKFPWKLDRIHSLIVQGPVDADGLVNNLEVFQELRVLVLSEVGITSLPESIGKLIHLRYLELHKTDIEELPESICRLYHLEGLDVSYCEKLQHLPKGLCNIAKLRLLKQ